MATSITTGQMVSHYRVLRQIGSGGMGIVFEAEDIKLGRRVALKFLPTASDEMARRRFEREARTASSLSHPHICTIYEVDEHKGTPFIAMELLEGRTLARHITGRPLTSERILEWGTEIAEALEVAYAQDIVHRDIKPGNIFITSRNQVKVLDFGLAKKSGAHQAFRDAETLQLGSEEPSTTVGTVVGTTNYMSPEQARGEQLDARTDLFSFGTVLYEMATGTQAFSGTTSAVVFDALLHRIPASPSQSNAGIPAELDRIISKAMAKDRQLRYQTATDMRVDLQRLRTSSPTTLPTMGGYAPSATPRSTRALLQQVKRYRAGLLVLALLAAGAVGTWVVLSPTTERPNSAASKQGRFADIEGRVLTGHTKPVTSVAFSPDGRWVASGSDDKTIKLWEVATGSQVRTLVGHTAQVLSVAFSPDGRWLASGGNDGSIRLWEVATGSQVRTFTANTAWDKSVAFSPDGRWLASGGLWNETVKLWEVATGRQVRTLVVGHTDGVSSVAFSPDGRWLAAAGSPDDTVKLWEVATGREVRTTYIGHTDVLHAVAFSPDGRWLASSSLDKTIKLWEVATGSQVRTFTANTVFVNSVAFSPDGRWLASGSDDKTIKLWEVATGRQVRTLVVGHTDGVHSVAFSPDGRWLASGNGDNTVRIWNVTP